MPGIPRLALGTLDELTDPWPLLRVVLKGFAARKVHVQTFLSRAAFGGFQELRAWSGATPRHLDSWLMSPAQCRSFFIEGTERADLALVLGRYRGGADIHLPSARGCTGPHGSSGFPQASAGRMEIDDFRKESKNQCCLHSLARLWRSSGGDLDSLCEWLGLARLVVLSARHLSAHLGSGGGALRTMEGVFLTDGDLAIPPSQYAVEVEVLVNLPLVGVVYRGRPNLLWAASDNSQRWHEGGLTLWWDFGRFQRLLVASAARPLPGDPPMIWDYRGRVQVAIARDAVFGCYFPETLEHLEKAGARIVEFSPLRDERIPPETDVIYLGCGEPRQHAARLAENHCLKASLRDFVRRGGRVYAEGAGAAYLCEWMEVNTGCFIPGVGILPAAGRRLPRFGEPLPVTVTLRTDTWLADAGTAIRGYRNSQWWFEPASVSTGLVNESGLEYDMIGNTRVVASVVHIDFAAQPTLLGRFFEGRGATGSSHPGGSLFLHR